MTERTVANDRYVLSEPPLGAGGMGTVWRAYDTVLRREVAIKEVRIPDGLRAEERATLRERAMREARAAAGLNHPGIVTVHDVVDEDDRPWIVMRLLPGQSLDEAVRADGPLSLRDAAELGTQLLDALVAAHSGGVLHRDVKPQNVLHDVGGRWMLTDFGIASVSGATRTLTGTGLVTGTLGYVAPERLSGAAPAAAADLWSLGATIYFAVEGRHAYDHDDLPAMIAAVLTRDPEPPDRAGPLGPVVAGLMARDPDRRMAPAAARKQLLAVVEGRTDGAETEVLLTIAGRPTENLDRPTKLRPAGTRQNGGSRDSTATGGEVDAPPATPRSQGRVDPAEQRRVLRVLAWLLAALNGALGALLGLLVYSLVDGMPIWIAGVLAGALALSGALGAWLAARLTRWLGFPAALAGTALLTGESLIATGAWALPQTPLPGLLMVVAALVAVMAWYPIARSTRHLIVPAGNLARVERAHRAGGVAAVLVGAAAAYGLLAAESFEGDPFDGNYPGGTLVSAGAVVMVAALLSLPAIAALGATLPGGVDERPSRGARVALVIVLLVIPLLVAGIATVQYLDRRDDFTTAPDICSSDVLPQERIAELMPDPPDAVRDSGSDYVTCDWQVTDESGQASQLEIEVTRYDDSGEAGDALRSNRESAEDDGEAVTSFHLGDGAEAIRYPYDGTMYPYDSTKEPLDVSGTSVDVRVDNLVLEVALERSEGLGRPGWTLVGELANDLTRELESRQPNN